MALSGALAPAASQDSFAHWLFWADGDGVGALDLRYNQTVDALDAPVATGTLEAPMLYAAASPVPQFASARAGRLAGLEAHGEIHRFGDASCAA
jgi:hypothetical protein